MKAQELMIGDWVKTNPSCGKLACDIKSRIARVSEIGFSTSDGMYVSFVGIKGRYYDDEIEPIPLTEEILHKNGFKNDVIAQKSIIAEGASNFSVILISEDNRITLNNIDEYINSFNKWSIHIDTEDMRTMCTAEITYVHELQHLLKLCKIEKEIVL